MNTTQQVLIVLAGLALLPLVIRLLRMAHLLPAALYLFVTRLCFPDWAAANSRLCAGLFAGGGAVLPVPLELEDREASAREEAEDCGLLE